jgi:CO dehydrogenase/acetyl-CoA synthase alpha subunit
MKLVSSIVCGLVAGLTAVAVPGAVSLYHSYQAEKRAEAEAREARLSFYRGQVQAACPFNLAVAEALAAKNDTAGIDRMDAEVNACMSAYNKAHPFEG